MGYELKQTDIYGFASAIGAQTVRKGNELFFRHCPYCRGGAKGDRDTFSVNLETGAFKCFRASCGMQGHFVQLARDNGYALDFGESSRRREYRALPQKKVEVREPAVEYMAKRGISREVTERYSITTQKDKPNVLVFPFYDADGVLRFVKYRRTDFDKSRDKCKEWSESDAMPILFGMDHCQPDKPLIITEGQIDSLSLAECGIENAVSVPTGALGMTWIDNCWDWLMKFSGLIIFGDNEHGGVTLVERIAERLPLPIRVVRQEDYYGEKDANDILRKYGRDAVRQAVENAGELIVDRIKELADVKPVDLHTMPHILTRVPELDRMIGGMYYGQVILLTGKRGEGKSTFMSQLIAEALDQDIKTLAYSGELPDYHFKRWLDLQLAGKAYLTEQKNSFGDIVWQLPEKTAKQIGEWYRGKMYIYDNNSIGDKEECAQLIETVELAIQRHGIRFICLDNLMTALDVDPDRDIYRAQSSFLRQLKRIAQRYNVVVLLVAHPKKTKDDVAIEDISGSGDIANRVDVVLSYSREGSDGRIRIFKNRLTGRISRQGFKVFYSESSKRIVSGNAGRRSYGWENGGFTQIAILPEELPF